MEAELGDLGQGPDLDWHQRFARGAEPSSTHAEGGEADTRRAIYQKILASLKVIAIICTRMWRLTS